MTTLEAATEFGKFPSLEQAERFIQRHDADVSEAHSELGETILDAYALCIWLGY